MFKPRLIRLFSSTFSGIRNVSTAHCRYAMDKALLSKLRKQTGIPFINCKKALEKFDNDFDQAKKWLEEESQREGWARATKLQTRPMSQGLVAILGGQKHATMIEVNCETDFVARTEKFVNMVTELVKECDTYFKNQTHNQLSLKKEHLDPIVSSQQSALGDHHPDLRHLALFKAATLGDIVALNVGNMGENMALRRAAFLRCDSKSVLSSYVHPSAGRNTTLMLGKYGALVEMEQDASIESSIPLVELGSHLCQHIVGMNPKSIGEYTPQGQSSESDNTSSSSDESSDESSGSTAEIEGEDRLLGQEFLLDTSLTVGELTHLNGVQIKNFVRFACGEELEDEKSS